MRSRFEYKWVVRDMDGRIIDSWFDSKEARGQALRIGGTYDKELIEEFLPLSAIDA